MKFKRVLFAVDFNSMAKYEIVEEKNSYRFIVTPRTYVRMMNLVSLLKY